MIHKWQTWAAIIILLVIAFAVVWVMVPDQPPPAVLQDAD